MQSGLEYTLPENQPAPSQAQPWGAWATIGWGALVFIAYSLVQGLVFLAVAVFSLADLSEPSFDELFSSLMTNGLALSLSIIVAAPFGIALIIVFIRLRKGPTVADYLGLRPLAKRTILLLVAIPIGLLIIMQLISTFLVKTTDAGFMLDAYKNTAWPVLFWLAVVVFAPAFEESLFRGFAMPGLRQSRLGSTGAVVLTAVIWALLHIQYDWFGMTVILIMGIILGVVRIRSNSLWGPLTIHAVWNLLQMVAIVLITNGVIEG